MDQFIGQSLKGKEKSTAERFVEFCERENNSGSGFSFVPKLFMLDFPTSWLCQVEQFLQFHNNPENEHISIASFIWKKMLKFKEGFHSMYGPNQLFDFFGELSKLQQLGTVQDYQTQFEKLLVKWASIRTNVQANRPKTLSKAISLARLCKKLFSIQAVLENSDDDAKMEIEDQDSTEIPTISLHALSSFEGPWTIWLCEKLSNMFGTILVDSGSTHNFVSERFAKKAGLVPTKGKRLKVVLFKEKNWQVQVNVLELNCLFNEFL
ncbi:hypothetical protein K2173_020389 [Erythroxylum novogranatense]|uniref:Retrotransposon gag domain-containing protein n=1 Tax=Erythroxylum novogranatense TaxID=1862640 RepID=A0AAV8TIV9_9ROSI|nr:hypothetical protein K2173_020389 [Erythroxylum novogranatense]